MTTSGELHGYAKAMRRELTPAEQLLWHSLRNRQLCGVKFRRQHPFGTFIFDFYAPELKLVIEVDGGIHLNQEHRAYDAWRDEMSVAQHLRVVRFTNAEVLNDLDAVLLQIAAVIAECQRSPGGDTPPN